MDESQVSLKSLVVWALLATAAVVILSYRPSTTTTEAPPVVATAVQAVPAPNLIPPAAPPVGATERGHWLWIPDKNPNLPPGSSYSIPAAPHH